MVRVGSQLRLKGALLLVSQSYRELGALSDVWPGIWVAGPAGVWNATLNRFQSLIATIGPRAGG